MDKVSLNGVEIFPFDSDQQLLHYVDTHKGILVAINAEKILHATEQTRAIINRNIGYCDGAGTQIALKQKGYKEACKIPGCELWLKIITHFYKEKTFYLVGGKQQIINETVEKLRSVIVNQLQETFPTYKEKFPIWAQQTSAMHQLVIWSMLEEAGFGVSLQHYNPLIDEMVQQEWQISSSWELVAQMPFGIPVSPPDSKESKAVGDRVLVFE